MATVETRAAHLAGRGEKLMAKFSKEYTPEQFISVNDALITLTEFFADLMESLGHHGFLVIQSNDYKLGVVALTAKWVDEGES